MNLWREPPMKRVVLLVVSFFVVSLATPVIAANPNANWRALVAEAYTQSELVVRGTVQSIDDQTMVDGGHVYKLKVTGRQKGAPGEQVMVRAGGFFYHVPLNKGESVLVFLKSTNAGKHTGAGKSSNGIKPAGQGQVYSLVEVATLRPMVFRVSGKDAKPVDNRLQAEFANVTSKEMDNLLSTIKP